MSHRGWLVVESKETARFVPEAEIERLGMEEPFFSKDKTLFLRLYDENRDSFFEMEPMTDRMAYCQARFQTSHTVLPILIAQIYSWPPEVVETIGFRSGATEICNRASFKIRRSPPA